MADNLAGVPLYIHSNPTYSPTQHLDGLWFDVERMQRTQVHVFRHCSDCGYL